MSNKRHILVVEDEPTVAAVLVRLLGVTNTAVAVPTLQRAISSYTLGAYDLIVLDLNLPDSLGIATYEKLRAEVGPNTPILICTGITVDSLPPIFDPLFPPGILEKTADNFLDTLRLIDVQLDKLLGRFHDEQ